MPFLDFCSFITFFCNIQFRGGGGDSSYQISPHYSFITISIGHTVSIKNILTVELFQIFFAFHTITRILDSFSNNVLNFFALVGLNGHLESSHTRLNEAEMPF